MYDWCECDVFMNEWISLLWTLATVEQKIIVRRWENCLYYDCIDKLWAKTFKHFVLWSTTLFVDLWGEKEVRGVMLCLTPSSLPVYCILYEWVLYCFPAIPLWIIPPPPPSPPRAHTKTSSSFIIQYSMLSTIPLYIRYFLHFAPVVGCYTFYGYCTSCGYYTWSCYLAVLIMRAFAYKGNTMYRGVSVSAWMPGLAVSVCGCGVFFLLCTDLHVVILWVNIVCVLCNEEFCFSFITEYYII